MSKRAFQVVALRLPWTVGTEQLKQYFAKYGPVSGAKVVYDEATGFSRGFGFVSFEGGEEIAQKAVSDKNHVLDGVKVEVAMKTNEKANFRNTVSVNIDNILGKN